MTDQIQQPTVLTSHPGATTAKEQPDPGATPGTGREILRIDDAVVTFDTPGGPISPVDGVSLTITEGETVGLVGESGCGKFTLGRLILQLTRASSGHVQFLGVDLGSARASALRALRRQLQVIFQDPRGSLDPKMSVRTIVA